MEIFNRLKIKIIFSVLSVLTICVMFLFLILNLFMLTSQNNQNNEIFTKMYDDFQKGKVKTENKELPMDLSSNLSKPSTKKSNNIVKNRNAFVVVVEPDKQYKIICRFPLTYTNDEIIQYVKEILKKKNSSGKYLGFRYQIKEQFTQKILLIIDRKAEDEMQKKLYYVCFCIFVISIIVGAGLAYLFANWAIKPVSESMRKQKEFIANASHELKTPLGVLNANVDILSTEIGNNKWINFIKSEVSDMNKLIKDLIYLAQIDVNKLTYEIHKFNISNMILKDSLQFESLIFEQKKHFEINCQDNLFLLGDEQRIHQLFVILIDNAMKHSIINSEISVTLKSENNKIYLSIYNTGDGIDPTEKDKIFERFYRSDTSRTRQTGGTGLGLAIAKEIVDLHKGKIIVESEKTKWIRFTVIL